MGDEKWTVLITPDKYSHSDLVQSNVYYKYTTDQSGVLAPTLWTDKLRRLSPPTPVEPVVSVTMEQNFTEWRLEYSFPNFFISAPGAWIGVNVNLEFTAEGGWSWNEADWKFEFDLSGWAADVISEGAVLNVDSETGRAVARFLGKVIREQTLKLVFVVTANIELETLERSAAVLGSILLAFWSQEITLRRERLRAPASDRQEH